VNLIELKCDQSSELGVGGSNPSARATQNNRFQRGPRNLSALKRDKKRDTVCLVLTALLLLGGCENFNCSKPDQNTNSSYCAGYWRGKAEAKDTTTVHGGER